MKRLHEAEALATIELTGNTFSAAAVFDIALALAAKSSSVREALLSDMFTRRTESDLYPAIVRCYHQCFRPFPCVAVVVVAVLLCFLMMTMLLVVADSIQVSLCTALLGSKKLEVGRMIESSRA